MEQNTLEFSTAIIGLVTGIIMYLARYGLTTINTLPGYQKMLIVLGLNYILPLIGNLIGYAIPSLDVLATDQTVASGFSSFLVSMGMWAGSKEIMKVTNKYNLTDKK